MPFYSIFGLCIDMEISLPALLPGEGKADVVIRKGHLEPPELTPGKYGLLYQVTPESVYLRWEQVGDFSIRTGTEITYSPAPGVAEETLMRFILGSALGATLFLRRELALHASAVAGPEGAIVFIGDSGWGKSTLAASLYARGYRMIADDIVAIRNVGGVHLIYPGLPEFKLWPDTLLSLGEDHTALPEVFPGEEKRVRVVHDGVQCQPIPLKRLYVLARGAEHAISPLSPVNAALELIRHTYGVLILHAIMPAQHFLQCTALVQSVPVRLFSRRNMTLAELPALLDLVEGDLQHDE